MLVWVCVARVCAWCEWVRLCVGALLDGEREPSWSSPAHWSLPEATGHFECGSDPSCPGLHLTWAISACIFKAVLNEHCSWLTASHSASVGHLACWRCSVLGSSVKIKQTHLEFSEFWGISLFNVWCTSIWCNSMSNRFLLCEDVVHIMNGFPDQGLQYVLAQILSLHIFHPLIWHDLKAVFVH